MQQKNEEDIKKFVFAKLDEDAIDRAIPFSISLREEIVDTLFLKSLGMYVFSYDQRHII